ncbi:MAG: hypothetical protein ACK5HT_20965 [Draconibacterium sp.]
METREKEMARMFEERLRLWKESQAGQTDGYEYERSFAEMMRKIEEEVFRATGCL